MTVYTDYYPSQYQTLYGQPVAQFPPGPLDLRGDLYLGSWQDFTPFIYQRAPVQIQRGRQNQAATISPANLTMTVDNRDNRWTVRNPTGPWYGQLVQNTPVRLSVPSSLAGIGCYLRMETDTASNTGIPDVAALQITTGTLSVRLDCQVTDYSAQTTMIGKWGSTGDAWLLEMTTSGAPLLVTFDGTSTWFITATLPLPYFNGRIAVRVDYNIGAQTVTFFTAPTMSGAWTQLGNVVSTGATTLAAAAGQSVRIGGSITGRPGFRGQVYEAQILSTGTTVADPVFTSQIPGQTSFTDGQSNMWTLTGTAELSGRNYRFHGELWSLPKASDPSQRDLYATAQAGGITRRLQQQQTPADSAMKRAYVRLPASLQLAAYWPGEDLAGATQIGQAVGNHAMTNVGLTMASDTTFVSSAAIPVMNGGTATALVDPASVTWTDNVFRFNLAFNSGDDTPANNTVIARFTTQGTNARVDLIYTTGGNLQMNGYNAAGGTVFTGSNFSFGLGNLAACRVSMEILGNNTANLFVQPIGSGAVGGGGTAWAGSIGGMTGVSSGGGGLVASGMGHWSVQGLSDAINDLSGALSAWVGETAAARFARLAGEEGYQARVIGPPSLSQPMGNQTQQTISSLLQECETTDQGQMFEPRQILGLGYITQWALCNQPAAVAADFSLAELMPNFSPASDDQLAVNDVTFTAADGSTSRQVLTTGAMSVNAPPAGIGRFDTQVTSNPQYDSQLANEAGWFLHQRSADEDRYPDLPFHMSRTQTPASVQLADIGSYVTVANTPAWVPPTVKQLVAGYTETFLPQPVWTIDFNGIPERPYEVATLDDLVLGHLDTAGCQMNLPAMSGAASITVRTTAGPSWTTAGGDYPFNLMISGMEITVSACTAQAGGVQTFTVSAWGVNGVTKNLAAGADVRLAHPMILAM